MVLTLLLRMTIRMTRCVNDGVLRCMVLGGIQWNWMPNEVGHSVFNQQPVYMATVHTERGDVVRLWEFDRWNATTWQVDVYVCPVPCLTCPLGGERGKGCREMGSDCCVYAAHQTACTYSLHVLFFFYNPTCTPCLLSPVSCLLPPAYTQVPARRDTLDTRQDHQSDGRHHSWVLVDKLANARHIRHD